MKRIAIAGATGAVGRHVVQATRDAGHEPIAISRATGVDLTRPDDLAGILEGCDAVIDVSSTQTLSTKVAVEFFGTVTENLLDAERRAGVPHHIALSIVGAAKADSGYYAGKAVQEQLVFDSGTGWSVLRATQFHEFAAQTVGRGAVLGVYLAPRMLCRPVAATEVATALVGIAAGGPQGLVPDLGGPRIERMADLVRRYLRATGTQGRVLEVKLPGSMGRVLADGSLIPGPAAVLGRQTFDEWLESLTPR
ncbi:MAG TPA: NAD(P)H-binding protein [Microbacteriaceae bacterium]|nr:NAD(P)H-binding protein [Microbacteriaceae bacterium]